MRTSEIGVEDDPAFLGKTCSELDVLDRRMGIPVGVESADVVEHGVPHGSEAGPERADISRRALVNGVVEQVAKPGHDLARSDEVVVGADDSDEVVIQSECLANPRKDVGLDNDVRVDEDDDIGLRLEDARVAGLRRSGAARRADNDDLGGRIVRCRDRSEAAVKGGRIVGRRDNDGERGRQVGQRCVSARTSSRRSSTGSLNVTSSTTSWNGSI